MRVRNSFFAVTALLGVFALATTACGGSSGSGAQSGATKPADVSPAGDIPDTQAFVTFSSPDGRYTVTFPEGWARTNLPTGAMFTDKLNSVRIESTQAPAPPTAASARATEIPALRAASAHFRLTSVGTVRRNAGDALLVTYRADGPADPVTGKRRVHDNEVYEFWKAGMIVTITLSSPHGADNVDPWRTVTNSFTWTP